MTPTRKQKRNPTPNLATGERRSSEEPPAGAWGLGAISVPDLQLQREVDDLELGVLLGLFLPGEQRHVVEVRRELEALRELGDVVAVTREAFEAHGALRLEVAGEPEPAAVPPGEV